MDPAITVDMRRNADGGVGQLRWLAVTIEAKLHMDSCKIRDRAPCPIALDPICGSMLGHDRLPTSRDGLLETDLYSCLHNLNN